MILFFSTKLLYWFQISIQQVSFKAQLLLCVVGPKAIEQKQTESFFGLGNFLDSKVQSENTNNFDQTGRKNFSIPTWFVKPLCSFQPVKTLCGKIVPAFLSKTSVKRQTCEFSTINHVFHLRYFGLKEKSRSLFS